MHSESIYSGKKRDSRTELKKKTKTLKWQMEEMEPTKETENEQVEMLEGNQDRVEPWESRRR